MRKEFNIRRIGEVSKLFVECPMICPYCIYLPYREDRQMVREHFAKHEFIEIYVKCPLEVCQRETEGLNKKLQEEIKFTGISAPCEEPLSPEIIVESDKQTPKESVQQVDSVSKGSLIHIEVNSPSNQGG